MSHWFHFFIGSCSLFKRFFEILFHGLGTLILLFRKVAAHTGNSFIVIKYRLYVYVTFPCKQTDIKIVINKSWIGGSSKVKLKAVTIRNFQCIFIFFYTNIKFFQNFCKVISWRVKKVYFRWIKMENCLYSLWRFEVFHFFYVKPTLSFLLAYYLAMVPQLTFS